jgi:hypothetical protein
LTYPSTSLLAYHPEVNTQLPTTINLASAILSFPLQTTKSAINLLLSPTPSPRPSRYVHSICRSAHLEQNVRSFLYPQKSGPLFLLHCYVDQCPLSCVGARLASSWRYRELSREPRLRRVSCLWHPVSDSHLRYFEFVPKPTKKVADFC